MEVLAIIAYKQPITRAEIDNVRGVDSGGVIDTLTDRKFIKIVGRKETLGRPLLYGTTQEFLRHFGLSHLSELPIIEAAKDVLPEQKEDIQELPFDNKESNENIGNSENEKLTQEIETTDINENVEPNFNTQGSELPETKSGFGVDDNFNISDFIKEEKQQVEDGKNTDVEKELSKNIDNIVVDEIKNKNVDTINVENNYTGKSSIICQKILFL